MVYVQPKDLIGINGYLDVFTEHILCMYIFYIYTQCKHIYIYICFTYIHICIHTNGKGIRRLLTYMFRTNFVACFRCFPTCRCVFVVLFMFNLTLLHRQRVQETRELPDCFREMEVGRV